jgi:hypothetical protein
MRSFWSITLATLVKDVRLEWRSKDALNAMLFFSLLVVVIFVFSFDPLAEESRHIVGGLVCGNRCPEPDQGAGIAQSGARRLSRVSGSGERVVPGQGAGKLHTG